MANNLEFWDGKLHLEKMRELIKVILVNDAREIIELNDIKIGEKTYNVSLKDDVLHINCSDGRDLYISLYKVNSGKMEVEPRITYIFNNDYLNIKGEEFYTGSICVSELFGVKNLPFDRDFLFFNNFYSNYQLTKIIEFNTSNGTNKVSFLFGADDFNIFRYKIYHSEFGIKRYFRIG